MSQCQLSPFSCLSLPCSPFLISVPAIIQLVEEVKCFQSHLSHPHFLTSPSLDSMDKYYNQFACNSFVPLLSHLLIPQLWLNSTVHFLCLFAIQAECSLEKSSIIDGSFSKFMSNNCEKSTHSARKPSAFPIIWNKFQIFFLFKPSKPLPPELMNSPHYSLRKGCNQIELLQLPTTNFINLSASTFTFSAFL